VEDTEAVSFAEIEAGFGPAVRRIVEGETKFSKVGRLAAGGPAAADVAAADLQQLFLAMTEEVRIIVVKLADRLHNMRTLGAMPPRKQARIAAETLLVFAPLARLLGLYAIKEELEELSFRYSDPEAHKATAALLAGLAADTADGMQQARAALEARLRADPYLASRAASVHVVPLQKSAYWAHRKAAERGMRLEDMADAAALRVAALRVVIEPDPSAAGSTDGDDADAGAALCYHAMGLVHAAWAPLPGAVKDYICTPKTNEYQALHTTVLPFGVSGLLPLEVQIRSAEMHRRSEYGVAAAAWAAPLEAPRAAPFATKGGRGDAAAAAAARAAAAAPPTPPSLLAARRNSWLAAIREWQAEFVGSLTAQEFVDCVTGDLLASARVFAFTPAGDVVRLPRGATVVDFAYHVHTDVGNEMIGARVNGAPAPADRPLHNADVVDVVTQSGPPTRLQLATHDAWLKHARTRSARHKLARFLREHGWPPPDEAQARDRVAREARARGRDREAREAADAGATLADPRSAPPPPPHVAWLTVECVDRAGLLADVSAAIAGACANIRSYSGARERGGASAGGLLPASPPSFAMRYEVDLAPGAAAAEALVAAVEAAPGVVGWALGCDLLDEDG